MKENEKNKMEEIEDKGQMEDERYAKRRIPAYV
jgi:hypothetical protein